MKHVYLFGPWPAGGLRHGYISNIQAGAPPRNQFVPEGERARSKKREWNCWNDFEGKCLSVSRRPFPPGDRVTFNGRDCLCQLCAQPMSSSPNEATCSSSKCTATTPRNAFVVQRWLRKMPSFGKVLFAGTILSRAFSPYGNPGREQCRHCIKKTQMELDVRLSILTARWGNSYETLHLFDPYWLPKMYVILHAEDVTLGQMNSLTLRRFAS